MISSSIRRDWFHRPVREMLADAFIDTFEVRVAGGMSVRIDVSQAHFLDVTAVAALDKVVRRFKSHGTAIEVTGVNAASSTLIERLDKAAVLGGT